MLSSDGFDGYIQDDEIADIACKNDPETACKKLLEKALENGSTDDITISIAHLKDR